MGAPQPAEAAPYYFKYIDRVGAGDITAHLQAQFEEALPFFRHITEEKSLHRYAAGKWSIRQTLNHVADAERVFAFRAFWFARGFESPLPSFDQDVCARVAKADETSWAGHIEDFQAVRSATIALFRNLPPEAWMRTGVASDNPFTVRALAYIIAGHLEHHRAILEERYL